MGFWASTKRFCFWCLDFFTSGATACAAPRTPRASLRARVLKQTIILSGPVSRDAARLSQRYPDYCALWGFWCLNMANWVRYPLPLFSAFPPWRACEAEVRYPPPPQKGYLSDTCAIPFENKENACNTPLCDTISKEYCAIWGGISHWAAKQQSRLKLSTSSQGRISAQGILHLRNPNLGPNSGKQFLGARILDPNSWVEFFDSVFSSKRGPLISLESFNRGGRS